MSPFWEPDTTTSTPQASIGRSAMPRLDTASTMRMAGVGRVTAAMPLTSWSTPVEDSLCCMRTALASGCRAQGLGEGGGGHGVAEGSRQRHHGHAIGAADLLPALGELARPQEQHRVPGGQRIRHRGLHGAGAGGGER